MAAISRRSEMTYSGCKAAIPPGGIFVSCLQMEQDRTSFASSFSFSRQVWQKTWRQFKILGCLSFSSQILHVCSSSPSRLMFGMGDTSRDCSGEAAGDISGEDMACLSKRNKDDTLCETRHWDSVLPPQNLRAQHHLKYLLVHWASCQQMLCLNTVFYFLANLNKENYKIYNQICCSNDCILPRKVYN